MNDASFLSAPRLNNDETVLIGLNAEVPKDSNLESGVAVTSGKQPPQGAASSFTITIAIISRSASTFGVSSTCAQIYDPVGHRSNQVDIYDLILPANLR